MHLTLILKMFRTYLKLIIETSALVGYKKLFTSVYQFVNGRAGIPFAHFVAICTIFHYFSQAPLFRVALFFCCCTFLCHNNFILHSCHFINVFIWHFHCSSALMFLSIASFCTFFALHSFILQSSMLH